LGVEIGKLAPAFTQKSVKEAKSSVDWENDDNFSEAPFSQEQQMVIVTDLRGYKPSVIGGQFETPSLS
jgi:hypothetical protein